MRTTTAFFSALAISTSLLLTGCGGGAVIEGEVVVEQPPVQVAAFDVIMLANGQRVGGVNLLPGQEQDVQLPAGNSFEFASSGPVRWTVVTGNQIVNPPVRGILLYGGIAMTPSFITNARYAADTSRTGFLSSPVVVSFIITSTVDPSQESQINLVLTN